MAQKEENLGEMVRDPHEDSLIDHKWLDAQPGVNYDNIPSEFNHQAIPELEKQWSNDDGSSPFYLVPNQVIDLGSTVDPTQGQDQIVEVVKVTKKAMMSGMPGHQVLAHLRERFPEETLKAASSELKKVASEDGLLGNVYIDLSAYTSTREAALQLGHHKVRLASFAVGAPTQERNYVDSFGRCRNLSKTVVASVDYSPRVLSHYETCLKNSGAIAKTASITNKEELRQAFIQSRTKRAESLLNTDEHLTGKLETPDRDMTAAALGDIEADTLAQNTKTASQLRIAQARPVIAKIQNMMLKGAVGDSLKHGIRTACDSETISSLKLEIAKLASMQGLIGPLFVDVSAYSDVKTASAAVASSYIKPRYLIATMPVQMGFMDKVASHTGIPVFTKDSTVTAKDASEVILAFQGAGRLSDEATCSYLNMVSAGEQTPLQAIRCASLDTTTITKAETRVAVANQTYLSAGDSVRNVVDRTTIKKAAQESMERGLSVTSVRSKIASLVPIGEALGIMRDTLSSMTRISADVLDACQSEKYPLMRTASLVCTHKCGGCVFHQGAGCSRQGLTFEGRKMASSSESVASTHIAQEYGIQHSAMIVDLSNVVIPAKLASTNMSMGSRASLGDITF